MLLPLLSGKVHIPRFHLEGVRALAETNASGISNWMLTDIVDDAAEVDEALMVEALSFGHAAIQPFIAKLAEMREQVGKEQNRKAF